MTRADFVDNVTTWRELIDFCYDEGISNCEDVYDDDSKDEWYNDDLTEMARSCRTWQELRDELDDIPTGYDYYVRDDGGFRGADNDDFEYYKNDILDYYDDYGYWDDDDEDPDEEPIHYEEPSFPDDEEPVEVACSINELFTTCASGFQKISHCA